MALNPRIKLHHLRDFVAIARHQSVRAAARALGTQAVQQLHAAGAAGYLPAA